MKAIERAGGQTGGGDKGGNAPLLALLNDRDFATEFFIIAELAASTKKTELPLCPRCRKHEPLVESGLCQRCDDVIAKQPT